MEAGGADQQGRSNPSEAMRPTLVLHLGACAVASGLTVHLVPHTHDDVGWLKTVDQYYSGANNTIQQADVRQILDTVTDELLKNPERKFTYVEQAFFMRWWRELDPARRAATKKLVASGQLQFVNGGWCMHDEAATHYIDMVDQTTLGHRLLIEAFGKGTVPTVGWQLDPFGHSATQAALLSYEAGFDALFFGRIDYQDLALRHAENRSEFVWRASPSLGPDAQVFTGLTGEYLGNYGPPPQGVGPDGRPRWQGFNWETDAEPVEDNPKLSTWAPQPPPWHPAARSRHPRAASSPHSVHVAGTTCLRASTSSLPRRRRSLR